MSKNKNEMKKQNREEMKSQNKAQMNKPQDQIADVPNPPVPNRARTPLSSTNDNCKKH